MPNPCFLRDITRRGPTSGPRARSRDPRCLLRGGMRTKPRRAVTSELALPHMRATTSRSPSQSQRRAPVQCLAVSDYCCSATVWPAAMVREDGDMRPRVTASKNSIAAAADATAIVRVKSDTGVPSHVIPSTEFFEKIRFQFVRGRLNCASIERMNHRSCRREGCRRRDQPRVASGRSSCGGRADSARAPRARQLRHLPNAAHE